MFPDGFGLQNIYFSECWDMGSTSRGSSCFNFSLAPYHFIDLFDTNSFCLLDVDQQHFRSKKFRIRAERRVFVASAVAWQFRKTSGLLRRPDNLFHWNITKKVGGFLTLRCEKNVHKTCSYRGKQMTKYPISCKISRHDSSLSHPLSRLRDLTLLWQDSCWNKKNENTDLYGELTDNLVVFYDSQQPSP